MIINKSMEFNEIVDKLLISFPQGRVGRVAERDFFFAYNYKNCNSGFFIDDIFDNVKLCRKCIEYFSRESFKSEPFRRNKENKEYHEYMLRGLNRILGKDFSEDDMDKIYTYLGNDVNKELCDKFIISDYDMDLLR